MPYIREGKCVYHKNPDGSKGKKKGCSGSEEEAKKYMRALYAAENKSMAEFSMAIVKASIPDRKNRTMRLSMVTSDTGEDAYEERMSVELYNDFVQRIESLSPVPEPFNVVLEDGDWKGGMPYPSISHYKSGNGVNVPGEIERVYVDGDKLKANAVLHDNSLGQAVWKSVCQDIEDKDKPLEEKAFSNPVRISIGFLDLEHKHELENEEDFVFTRSDIKQKCEMCEKGINGKVYLKGQLVHLAFTRVPANPRTSVEVLRMDTDEIIKTKKDDAKSIIGDLADELIGKSVVEETDVLVVKADKLMKKDESRNQEDSMEDDDEMKEEKKKPTSVENKSMEVVMEKEIVQEEKAPVVEEQKSALDAAFETLKTKVMENKGKGSAAYADLQPILNHLGNTVKSEVSNPAEAAVEITRATVKEEIAAAIPEIVAQILKSLPAQQPVQQKSEEVPVARSLFLNRNVVQPTKEMTMIEKLAYNSTVGTVTGQKVK